MIFLCCRSFPLFITTTDISATIKITVAMMRYSIIRARYSLFETISYLYWKIYKFYKKKGYRKWESGKIAKTVCMQRFGYENYQDWRHRFEDEHYSSLYYELKNRGYDRR